MRSRRRSTSFEPLESRRLLATTGVPWLDPRHLTFSFVPDGAPIASHASDLLATLDASQAREAWQGELARALQTWASATNVDFGLANDGGQRLGASGRVQHDPRFGDIRFAAHAMDPSSVSISAPHDPFLAGALSGDVFFNSAVDLAAIGTDLFSVALHELGHSLGLDHSDDPESVMFSHAVQVHTGLAASDIDAVSALYGARTPDHNEQLEDNDALVRATRIKTPDDDGAFMGLTPLVAYGDLTSPGDVDYFELDVLEGYSGPVTLRLQTRGVSLAAARLLVFNEAGELLGQSQTTDPLGGVASITLLASPVDEAWYLRIESAEDGVFGIGRYGVAATFDDHNLISPDLIDEVLKSPFETLDDSDMARVFLDPTAAFVGEEEFENDEPLTAVPLETTLGYAPQSHYETMGSVSQASDADVYAVKSLLSAPGNPIVATVTVQALQLHGGRARGELLDEEGRPLAGELLVNGDGVFTIQVRNLAPDSDYYVRVTADPLSHTEQPQTSGRASLMALGNYRLSISFGPRAAEIETFSAGTLSGVVGQQSVMLYVAEDQLFHFLLTVNAPRATTSSVRAQLVNEQGELILNLAAQSGSTASAPVQHLVPGTYRIDFAYQGQRPFFGPPVEYALRGGRLTKPVGPALEDPTLDTLFECPGDPSLFCYPGDILSSSPVLFFALLQVPTDDMTDGGAPPNLGTGETGRVAPRQAPPARRVPAAIEPAHELPPAIVIADGIVPALPIRGRKRRD